MSKSAEIAAHRTLLNLNRNVLEIYIDYEKRLNNNSNITIDDIEKIKHVLQDIDSVIMAWNTCFA